MHLFWDRPFNSMIFIGCLLFVSLFIGITLTDLRANERLGDRRGRLGDARRPCAAGEPAKVSDRPAEPRFVGSRRLDRRSSTPGAWE